MARNGNAHPGRSVEFLSRLHDGELEPGERARFEVHRAHCAECRRAALEFGDAISLFRSARSSPPRADLAARILHKVQSTHRSRTPFTTRFRTDLGWAGLLATAILALLIMTPIAGRRQETAVPSEPDGESGASVTQRGPLTVELRDMRQAPANARDRPVQGETAGQPARRELEKQASKDDAREKPEPKREVADSRYSSEPPRSIASENDSVARITAESARAGGVGEGSIASAPARAVRVSIEPADGLGPAPALASPGRLEIAREERGREYLLAVDPQGVVRQVSSAPSATKERAAAAAPAAPAAAPEIAAAQAEPPRSLYELRFEPGNRPRRLRVRIE